MHSLTPVYKLGDKLTDMANDTTLSGLCDSSQALLAYWREIRGGELVPSRSNFRPGDVTRLLPSLLLLEYRDPDALVYRLTGTEIVERMGTDFTGMNLFDLVLPHQLAGSRCMFNALRRQPCGLVVRTELLSKYNTAFVAELIYLPLLNREGEITQLVSVVSVIKRYQPGKKSGDIQSMTALESIYVDIGAGVPAPRSSARAARI